MLSLDQALVNRVQVANVLDRLRRATVIDVGELGLELEPCALDIHTMNEVPFAVDHRLRVVAPHVIPAELGQVAGVTCEVDVHRVHVSDHSVALRDVLLANLRDLLVILFGKQVHQ